MSDVVNFPDPIITERRKYAVWRRTQLIRASRDLAFWLKQHEAALRGIEDCLTAPDPIYEEATHLVEWIEARAADMEDGK